MIARAFFVLVLIVVSALFFTQNPPAGPSIPHLDKVVHFGLFFILAASMHYAFRLPWGWSLLLLAGYGIAIEAIQHHLPNRGADVWDLVADVAGAACFYALLGLWKRWRRG
ncbi:VanZ family protein [Aliidiomarina sp. Khilg15.8]